MAERAYGGRRTGRRAASRRQLYRLSLAAAVAGFAIVLWGGYDRSWSWTGLAGAAEVWDWLELLLLPLALALLPLWLAERHRIHRRRARYALLGMAAFWVFVALGYAFDWQWTGFPDNHLWDWLSLLALPAVITAYPLWTSIRDRITIWHRLAGAALLVAFVVVVIGGYAWHWAWTGFDDNKLWDWLHLLLLPLLVPLVVVPLTEAWMLAQHGEPNEGDSPPAL